MRYLIVLVLAGCAVNPQAVPGPHERQAYTMRCSGMGRTLTDCYKAAAAACPLGYDVVDSGTGVLNLRRELVVECR